MVLPPLHGAQVTPQLEFKLSPLGRGLRKRDLASQRHTEEIARLAVVMRKLALSGPTDLEALRRHEGLLVSKGRELSWLSAVPKAAKLVRIGYRRSTLENSGGHLLAIWRLP